MARRKHSSVGSSCSRPRAGLDLAVHLSVHVTAVTLSALLSVEGRAVKTENVLTQDNQTCEQTQPPE